MTDDELQALLCDINTRIDQYESRIIDMERNLTETLSDLRKIFDNYDLINSRKGE